MAIVPTTQKFHTVASNINTVERGSALSNAGREIYTMQDIIDTVGGRLEGTQYVFVAADGTDVENAAELQAAYVTAQGMSPSASRITVIAAPGNYNFSSNFVMDTEYIDLVSLDGNRSIVFNGVGTIVIDESNIFVKGVDVGTKSFAINTSLNFLRIENCRGGNYSFGYAVEIMASSIFIDCVGGYASFGGEAGIASGTFINCTGDTRAFAGSGSADGVFINCTGGLESFGSAGGSANGTFTDCTGGDYSFGTGGSANGTFTNCTGGHYSFGGSSGSANGVFTNCEGLLESFGNGSADGTFTNCTGGDESFGRYGSANGTFTNCRGGYYSFGKNITDGVFTNCIGGDYSFGNDAGILSGTLSNCIGGEGSFGGDDGVLSGKLYYCRLTAGTFTSVSGSGVTRLCIDGNNVENNQG